MENNFSYYLSKFLKNYLIIERNLSPNTIKSYKKTFQILIDYLVKIKNFKLQDITFENITREIILDFLSYLENDKHNTIRTRNQRLTALKSFYQYCSFEEIENINNITKVLQIKFKKFTKKTIDYLTEEELQTVFESIDTSSKKGRRDLTILVLLYDTAARASEVISLKTEDIYLEEKYVILTGKGDKQRVVPIMEKTKELLIKYMKENNIYSNNLIQNKSGNKMNERFIRDIIKKYAIENKNISPHVFRHTRAIHWLKAGISLIQIRDLLGHESVMTTEEYARVLNEDKFKAIEEVNKKSNISIKEDDWTNDQDLLNQLISL